MKKILEILSFLFSFLKRRDPKEVQEFTDLVKGQYNYLREVIERFQADYYELSERMKSLCREVVILNTQLAEAAQWRCETEGCKERS